MFTIVNKKIYAFSLIELSVVMAIIGVTLGGALTLATNITESDKISTTNTNMDVIENALGRFLIEYQRLPCPADGTVLISNSNFGVEQISASAATVAEECTANVEDAGSGEVWTGVVPTKTLDLPDEYMFDGWGRRITYSVDHRFANSITATNTDCVDPTDTECFHYETADASSITVLDDAAGSNITTEAIAVLLSHGKNGHGAYLRVGSVHDSGSTDASELQNASFNNLTFVQKDAIDPYDDITRYYLKWQLVDIAGAITSGALCTVAKTSYDVANPGTGDPVCDNATLCDATCQARRTECRTLTNQFFSLCLDM